jgi:SWI/SNF-related matrix-associated actin-dependent regulator 1 of chromatin subfamily A
LVAVIEGISRALDSRDTDYIRIDGQTPAHARNDLVKHFQDTPKCRVAVLSITAAGVGLNLTAANLVIFAELYWNPGVRYYSYCSNFVAFKTSRR